MVVKKRPEGKRAGLDASGRLRGATTYFLRGMQTHDWRPPFITIQ